MSFYAERILPHLIHLAMRQARFEAYRRRVVAQARGRVLEIGVGSGLNLPFYPPDVSQIVGLDPSAGLLARARERARDQAHAARAAAATHAQGRAPSAHTAPVVALLHASADAMPLSDRSIDTVVTTWTLCSVPDVARALREARRVLAPDGCLLFVEHGRSPDPRIARWQHRLTPIWKRVAGGCHLNRPVGQLIEQAGFRIEALENGYMEGPRPMTFMYEGRARLA